MRPIMLIIYPTLFAKFFNTINSYSKIYRGISKTLITHIKMNSYISNIKVIV